MDKGSVFSDQEQNDPFYDSGSSFSVREAFGPCNNQPIITFEVFLICAAAGFASFAALLVVTIILCCRLCKRQTRRNDEVNKPELTQTEIVTREKLPTPVLSVKTKRKSQIKDRPRPATLCLGDEVPIYAMPDKSRNRLVRSDIETGRMTKTVDYASLNDLYTTVIDETSELTLQNCTSRSPTRQFSFIVTPHIVRKTVKRYEELSLEDMSPQILRNTLMLMKNGEEENFGKRTDPDGEEIRLKMKLEKKMSAPML